MSKCFYFIIFLIRRQTIKYNLHFNKYVSLLCLINLYCINNEMFLILADMISDHFFGFHRSFN